MADEFDLEQEVARLRGKLKALTVITVLFMLASGGLAAAVLLQVRKPHDHPRPAPPRSLELDGLTVKAGLDGAALSPQSLAIKGTSGFVVIGVRDGEPELTFTAGGKTTTLTAAKLAELLAPPPPPPPPPAPAPTPEQPETPTPP